MGLMKSTSGLPKFTAACGFWRHPRWVGASLDEIGLHLAGISYCYEHGTDGALPAREALSAALGLRERQVVPALARLLGDGRWHDCGTQILIDGYLDHNPSADEVRESKAKRKAAGQKAAAKRWASESQSESHNTSYDASNANGRNAARIASCESCHGTRYVPHPTDRNRAVTCMDCKPAPPLVALEGGMEETA